MTDNLDPNIGHVFCDKIQIGNIFNYLTTNSIDSLEDRVGTIHVSASQVTLTPPLADKIGKLAPGKYAHISFADTGCGMDADNAVKIFDPFFTTKDVGKGTGLGLSMAYGIIERHGGAINVSSQVDAGTTFDIYLPLMDQSRS
jgi:signal transduction histidine kinase